MKKFIVIAVAAMAVIAGLESSTNITNAVYSVEDGIYYHRHGDCAVAEKSHDHNRKIYLTSQEVAEGKLLLPCRKCVK